MPEKLKIAVITLHRVKNYGSVLQACATQRLLEDMGAEAEIVDYISPRLQDRNARKILTESSAKANSGLKKLIHRLVVAPSFARQKRVFHSFVKHHLRLSAPYLTEERLRMHPPEADIYCTGSDQVFNSKINGMVEKPFYLDFVPAGRRKIAYAASFGIREIPEGEREETAALLRQYDYISVREDSGMDILRSLGVEGETVLDPVLCVRPELLTELQSRKKRKKPYILIYELNGESDIARYAEKVAAVTGWEVVRISYYYHHILKKGHTVVCPSVGEFISLFLHAELVMTDSFHGTALSLQFQKQFWPVMPPQYSTRLESILSALRLTGRIVKEDFDPQRAAERIDYSAVTPALEKLRESSMAFLRRAVSMELPAPVVRKSCTGCGLCEHLCPAGAIAMREDAYGFRYPAITESKCLHCQKCAICRMEDVPADGNPAGSECYAAVSSDAAYTTRCSSGGLFGVMAEKWLSEGGVVYGCAFDEKMKAKHVRVESPSELPALFGSKYLQSDISSAFRQTADDLAGGRKVMFCGTPCQTAAMRRRFGRNDNLFLIDILCHGVPSYRTFHAYLQSLSQPDRTCVGYSFRDRRLGWGGGVSFTLADGRGEQKEFLRPGCADSYYGMFYEGLILRPGCHECRYKGKERTGDITLSDFWGIEKAYPDFDRSRGVSLLLVNSGKGKEMLEGISPALQLLPADFEKAAMHNTTLTGNAPCPEGAEEILNLIRDKGFEAAEKQYWRSRPVKRMKALAKTRLIQLHTKLKI